MKRGYFAAIFFCLFAVPALVTPVRASAAACNGADATTYPKAAISNGQINAVLYLPDAKNGYYRGVRFDRAGVVGCLDYKGHSYFGVWFPHYDPLLHDAITGPVEEFRAPGGDSAIGYDAAKPGDPFIKIGVGVLRRIDDKPFSFATPYSVIDPGKWSVHSSKRAVTFRQRLGSSLGIAYDYKKTVELDPHEPVLLLKHELKNTGTQIIDTEVYDHDFYMIDNTPTGPDMVVRFPFDVKAKTDLGNGAQVENRQLVYNRELETGQSARGWLEGYSADASSYDFRIENRSTGTGVEQTADQPISRLFFWSIRTTVCPEAYIHIKVAPGETAHWTIRYRFYAR